jgi:aminoglycoside N3'-acetyltransferase
VASGAWTASALAADLRALGVAQGDLLIVHASLRAIGATVDGANTVVDALEQSVGSAGTLLMTLGALESDEPFDCLRTPADPDVGLLAEVFRTRPGTQVSDHPEGRFGARGARAAELVDDVPWHDYYGPGSPLERFVVAGGRVLRLGADEDTVTLLHYAEYLSPVPNKRRVTRQSLVAGPNGPERRTVECLDDSDGIVDYPGEDYFAVLLRAYLATGRARTGTVGNARGELIEARDLIDFGIGWMAEHLVVS